MDFVTDCIYLGYEKKEFKTEKGLREWLVIRFANDMTGEVISINADIKDEYFLQNLKILTACKLIVNAKARNQGGYYLNLVGVTAK